MAHCVGHEQCPRCAAKGNDRGKNNLAIYSDGSMYCFSCHYLVSASGIQKFKETDPEPTRQLALPHDASTDLPQEAQSFIARYGITKNDAKIHTLLWSQYYKRLIFPYFGDDGLLGWQGRYLGEERGKAKWYSQGNLRELVHLVGNHRADTVVLVEDVISAIKISHCGMICAVPLFGSHVDVKKVLTLKQICGTIKVWCWLDLDKQVASAQYSKKLRDFGFDSRTIITDLDPKCYSDEEIHEILKL